MTQTVVPTVIMAIITFASPLITAVFTKASMSSKAKNWVAIAVSLVLTVGYAYFNHILPTNWSSISDIAAALPAIYGLQQAVYNLILKDLAATVQSNFGVGAKEAAVAAAQAAQAASTVEPATKAPTDTVG